MVVTAKELESEVTCIAAAGDSESSVPNLQIFSLVDIEAATDKFQWKRNLEREVMAPYTR